LHLAQARMYAGAGDAEVRALLADDLVWHVPGSSPIAGDHRGLDAVLAYFERRRVLAQDTMRMHSRGLLTGDGEHVAALTDGTATIDGEEHAWSTVGLYRVRGGRVRECWLLPLDPVAFDRIWSGG
jgi:uncharacterized protein